MKESSLILSQCSAAAPAAAATASPREPVIASPLNGKCVHVRWMRVVSRFDDPFDAFVADNGAAGRERHAVVAFVVGVTFVGEGRAIVDAWLELPGDRRRDVARGRPAASCVTRCSGMVHADLTPQVPINGEFLLRLTLRGDNGELLFAATPLLAEAGFLGGSYDRPTARVTAANSASDTDFPAKPAASHFSQ